MLAQLRDHVGVGSIDTVASRRCHGAFSCWSMGEQSASSFLLPKHRADSTWLATSASHQEEARRFGGGGSLGRWKNSGLWRARRVGQMDPAFRCRGAADTAQGSGADYDVSRTICGIQRALSPCSRTPLRSSPRAQPQKAHAPTSEHTRLPRVASLDAWPREPMSARGPTHLRAVG